MSADSSELKFQVSGAVATITLNRPEKMNAFTDEMLRLWAEALTECAESETIRVVVLTGTGKAFCSGGDVSGMKDRQSKSAFERKIDLEKRIHRIPLILDSFKKPVIVAVNGVATGAGMDMALMGDIRIAARSAKFAETYVRMGLFSGDGGAWYLPRIVGVSKALELFWTARFVDAEEAERIGIVNLVVDDDELMATTFAMAEKIAQQPPQAIQMIKRAVYQSHAMDLRSHLDMASSHMAAIYSTYDHQEAVVAFKDKRKPNFKGR